MHSTAVATALVALASFAAAYTQPSGGDPSGNPIAHPGLGELIPAGQPYNITWQPTTPGKWGHV